MSETVRDRHRQSRLVHSWVCSILYYNITYESPTSEGQRGVNTLLCSLTLGWVYRSILHITVEWSGSVSFFCCVWGPDLWLLSHSLTSIAPPSPEEAPGARAVRRRAAARTRRSPGGVIREQGAAQLRGCGETTHCKGSPLLIDVVVVANPEHPNLSYNLWTFWKLPGFRNKTRAAGAFSPIDIEPSYRQLYIY